jgi:nucleoside-diphosphate-sugar epimerase
VRVLLTGANGFIGSHLLQELLAAGHRTSILLRETSNTRFIADELRRVDVHYGELRDPGSLQSAVRDAETVIHCAAKTKAVRRREYYSVNSEGTRNLVDACNRAAPGLRQFILVSSLSVSGPGTLERPAREAAPPAPVSVYGHSKMLAERRVRRRCRAPWTILRPAAVYGPRDSDFFLAFRAVRRGLMPLINGGRQRFSLIHVSDVTRAVLRAMGEPVTAGKTYHLAGPVAYSQRGFLDRIAAAMGVRAVPVFVPHVALYPVCLLQELIARVTRRASIMNLQKVSEYAAPGWVCATDGAARDLDFEAGVRLPEGLRRTFRWYVDQGWLQPV